MTQVAAPTTNQYKDAMAEGLGTNIWWHIEKRTKHLFWWIIGGFILGMVLVSNVFPASHPLYPLAYALMVCAGLAALAGMVIAHLAQRPGTWKRYTVTDFYNAYPTRTTWVSSKIAAVRSTNSAAEFSLDVLEREDLVGAQGIILYQWRAGHLDALLKDQPTVKPVRYPILLLNRRGNTVEYNFAEKPVVA